MIPPKIAKLMARATAGDAEAQAALAQAHEEGKGIKKNLGEAMKYWRLAAEKDHPRAVARLVEHHLDRNHRDEAMAIDYARRGASTGNPSMMSLLGRMALEATVMPQDLPLATEMLRRAAERDDTDALILYGQMLVTGQHVEPDVRLGLLYLESAARRDNETAMGMLARLYDEGAVTPRDPYKAFVFYGKSTGIADWHDHGDPFDRLINDLTGEQATEAKRVIDMYHYEQGHTDWSGPIY
jgi:TPR repeat protein